MPYPEAIKEFPLSFQIVIKKIYNRIESGKNALIVIVGQTGGGKSLAGIQLMRGLYLYRNGEEPSHEYILEHINFKARDFMSAMQKISEEFVESKSNLKKEANMWDEGGVGAGNREWQSVTNKIIGQVVQTFRNLQQVVIFTLPSISMLDSTIRKLLHYYMEVVYIDNQKKMCVVKPLEMQYNPRMDKIYYHNLTYPTKEELLEVEFIGIPKISDELENLYERKKARFTGELNNKILATLDMLDRKDCPYKNLTERQEKILGCLKEGIVSNIEICKKLGLKPYQVSENFRFMRNKGISIDSYKKNGQIGRISMLNLPLNLNHNVVGKNDKNKQDVVGKKEHDTTE